MKQSETNLETSVLKYILEFGMIENLHIIALDVVDTIFLKYS